MEKKKKERWKVKNSIFFHLLFMFFLFLYLLSIIRKLNQKLWRAKGIRNN